MKNKLVIGIILFIVLLSRYSAAGNIGPYSGKVIDDKTGAPIENASVVFYWEKRVMTPVGGYSELIKAELVRTDKKGEYYIGQFFDNLGLKSALEQTQIIIYQPGYQAYILSIHHDNEYSRPDQNFKEKDNIVKLERVPPNFDHAKHYESIEQAFWGIREYSRGDLMPTGNKVTPEIIEINNKDVLTKEELLSRAEWEERRGGR
jgi:hypothetical protein